MHHISHVIELSEIKDQFDLVHRKRIERHMCDTSGCSDLESLHYTPELTYLNTIGFINKHQRQLTNVNRRTRLLEMMETNAIEAPLDLQFSEFYTLVCIIVENLKNLIDVKSKFELVIPTDDQTLFRLGYVYTPSDFNRFLFIVSKHNGNIISICSW